ncbi:MAG: glycosyltransferase [Prevotellaceae bacterium]|jgi:glycosyltransferase involved in cell wall biosynthesis|nr:glycosyltransferase [Prevotellaceae bacterium]
MKQQPKISVIVPVYNAGKHFEDCLTSLAKQTLKEIEILLVLDCPTDGSDIVAKNLATKDERFKLIYNETNLHTGLSRNKGMQQAAGEYIAFCDHDDYTDPVMYEKLYQTAKHHDCDIVRCNAMSTVNGCNTEHKYPALNAGENIPKQLFHSIITKKMSGSIWNYIFKTKFVQENRILFPDTRAVAPEDSAFLLQAFFYAKQIEIIPDILYYSVNHKDSLCNNIEYLSTKNIVAYCGFVNQFLQKNNIVLDEKTKQARSFEDAYALYSAFSRSLRLLLLKRTYSELQLVKSNEAIMKHINSVSYRNILSNIKELKVFVFLLILKLVPRKKISST